MSVGVAPQAASPLFEEAAKVAIAQLDPDSNDNDQSHVEANVALIWPYSSSTRRMSLLLAERDIRLRKSKGQVKVTFHGDCAREVAETHVGIGDSVKLGLREVTWTRTGEDVATPGKKVAWDIDVKKQVKLEVQQGVGGTAAINFIAQPTSPTTQASVAELDGPKSNGFISVRKTRQSGSYFPSAYRTPSRYSSGSFIDASLDPFADDDGYVTGKGRKRTKFARHSGSWQLLDSEEQVSAGHEEKLLSGPSQTHLNEAVREIGFKNTIEVIETPDIGMVEESYVNGVAQSPMSSLQANLTPPMESDMTSEPAMEKDIIAYEPSGSVMGPPPIPPSVTPRVQPRPFIQIDDQPVMSPTPVLRPLPSPGLALVSPLVERSGLRTSYFPEMISSQSELDAISHATTEPRYIFDEASETLQHDRTDPGQEEVSADGIGLTSDVKEQSLSLLEDNVRSATEIEQQMDHDLDDTVPVSHNGPFLEQEKSTVLRDRDAQTPTTVGDVDLDALQRQIDDSSHQWQDSIGPPPIEDEDMYGPPVEFQRHGFNSTTVEEIEYTKQFVEQELQVLDEMRSQAKSSSSPISTEKQTISRLDDAVSEPTWSQSAVLIESSSDEGGDEEYEEDRLPSNQDEELEEVSNTEQQPAGYVKAEDTGEAGGTDDETDAEAEDLKRSLMQQNVEAVYQSTSPLAVSPSLEAAFEEFVSKASTQSLRNPTFPSSDGLDEPYEDEDQRRQYRTRLDAEDVSTNLQVVEILSNSSRSSSPASQDNDSEDYSSTDSEHHDKVDKASEANQHVSGDDGTDLATIDSGNELGSKNNIAGFSDVEQIASTAKELLQPVSADRDFPQQLTPDATQETHGPVDEMIPVVADEQPILPPTPVLTQDTDDQNFITPATVDGTLDQEKEGMNRAQLPDSVQERNEPLRRPSQRLSRKSFTSEHISTDYFTPRRSLRIVRSSPTLAPDPPSNNSQPTSPIRKRALGSSSPTVTRQEGDITSQPLKLLRGTTTALSYFPHLSTIHEYFNLQIDVIAVSSADSSQAQKAKSGPKDYHMTLHLADPSSVEANTTITAQIFRPSKTALPVAKRGDVILLRNMKVQTNNRKAMLLSTASSAWAVFKQTSGRIVDATVNGPPVEFEDAEEAEAHRLWSWWLKQGERKYPDLPVSADGDGGDERMEERRPTSPMLTRLQRRKAGATEEANNPSEVDQQGDNNEAGTSGSVVDSDTQLERRAPSPPLVSIATREQASAVDLSSPTISTKRHGHHRASSRRSESVVHQLRDGTKYIDDAGQGRSASVIHELRDGSTYVDD